MAAKLTPSGDDILGRRESEIEEFKREASPRFLEDVVAFLNTNGGTVSIGVRDEDGIAVGIEGVADPERESSRVRDLLADRIEPRPEGIEVHVVATSPGHGIVRVVVRASESVHALRDRAAYTVYRRVGDRNRPLSWAEAEALRGSKHAKASREPPSLTAMQEQRAKFLARRDVTTLRVAIWPRNLRERSVDLADPELRNRLAAGGALGVRESGSGWTYLSSSEVMQKQGRLETGRADPANRHLVIRADGRVEFTTDRDDIWAWHAHGSKGLIVDPFVLLEYPASVVRLAGWIHERFEIHDGAFVELVIRSARGARLGPGHPRSPAFGIGARWGRLEDDDLLVGETGPLEVERDDLVSAPDRVTFRLAREAYEAFGLTEGDIPLFDARSGRFAFGT